jgi:tryptophan-rich sensory protein
MAIVFAFSILAIGLGTAFIALALRPALQPAAGVSAEPVSSLIPPWIFWAVWLIIYPAQGIALWYIWRLRTATNIGGALAWFAVAFVENLCFWLTSSLLITAVIDTIGLVLAYMVAWVFRRYSTVAALWLLPWLLWMPITTIFKWWVVATSM